MRLATYIGLWQCKECDKMPEQQTTEKEEVIFFEESKETKKLLMQVLAILDELDINKRQRNKLDKLLVKFKQSVSNDTFKTGFNMGFRLGIDSATDTEDEPDEETPDLKA